MGRPKQFDALIAAVGVEWADIHNITLPGHGAGLSEFALSNANDWQLYVDDYIARLRARYDSIITVGHSMGGLLLINAMRTQNEKVKAIIAIALPLRIKFTCAGMMIRLKSILKPKENEDTALTYARSMCGVSGLSVLNTYRLIPNALGLLKIIRQSRAALPSLKTELTVVNSRNDELVSLKSIDLAKSKSRYVSAVILDAATHFWHPDNELYAIAKLIRGTDTGEEEYER